jgi:hypothetical protein
MLDVLYSRFWAATVSSSTRSKRGTYTKLNERQTESILKLLPVFAIEGNNFTTSTANIRAHVKRLPEMIDRAGARHGTNIKEDANVRLKNGPKHIEEPAMRIDLLLAFLL